MDSSDVHLLTYEDHGIQMTAVTSGRLQVVDGGCLAIGEDILVLPSKSSYSQNVLVVRGRRYSVGSNITMGGGEGSRPSNSPCSKDATYWYG